MRVDIGADTAEAEVRTCLAVEIVCRHDNVCRHVCRHDNVCRPMCRQVRRYLRQHVFRCVCGRACRCVHRHVCRHVCRRVRRRVREDVPVRGLRKHALVYARCYCLVYARLPPPVIPRRSLLQGEGPKKKVRTPSRGPGAAAPRTRKSGRHRDPSRRAFRCCRCWPVDRLNVPRGIDAIRNLRSVRSQCTVSAQSVHSQCTVSAQSVHSQCTVSAQSVHTQCTLYGHSTASGACAVAALGKRRGNSMNQ